MRAVLLLGLGLAIASGFGAAAQLDVRDDPSLCGRAVSRACLETLGAGAEALPTDPAAAAAAEAAAGPGSRACAEELAVYKACLFYASGGAAPQQPQAETSAPAPAETPSSLPMTVSGLLNPKQRETHGFTHAGGCVRVSTRDTTASVVVSLRTIEDVEVARRASKLSGSERVYTQFLPAGEYLLGVEARYRGSPYRVTVSAIGSC